MVIVLSGGTGFIGRALRDELLAAGHRVVLLTRRLEAVKAGGALEAEHWDAKTLGPWAARVDGADAVINLAGEPIATRWSPAVKQRIVTSRVEATRALVSAVSQARRKPSVFINASAVGYYGNVPEGDVPETHARGTGFLADTCALWEEAARGAEAAGVRVVLPRIGIVLERDGGALKVMTLPFLFWMGGPIGSGRQAFPWVHRDDVVGSILFALERREASGPLNLTAPQPVSLAEFCRALGGALGRPSWLPAPAFAVRLLAGEMADEMLLSGARVVPQRLLSLGYAFRYPKLDAALSAIFRRVQRGPRPDLQAAAR